MTSQGKDTSAVQNGFSDEYLRYAQDVFGTVLHKQLALEEVRAAVEDLINLEVFLRELRSRYGPKV
jgi:hypothetical protein